MRKVRFAICQLECHPAIQASLLNYLTEPFVPGQSSLSLLSTKGLDVSQLEVLCRDQYLAWHTARVASVLDFLGSVNPTPDIVLFPEASLPIELLGAVTQWSASTGATVLAGSHSPRRTAKAIK